MYKKKQKFYVNAYQRKLTELLKKSSLQKNKIYIFYFS